MGESFTHLILQARYLAKNRFLALFYRLFYAIALFVAPAQPLVFAQKLMRHDLALASSICLFNNFLQLVDRVI